MHFMRSRYYTECNATLSIRTNGDLLHVHCRRVTPSGFQGVVNARLQLAQLVRVEFHLRDRLQPVSLYARVASHDGFLYEFEVMSASDAQCELMEALRHLLCPPASAQPCA